MKPPELLICENVALPREHIPHNGTFHSLAHSFPELRTVRAEAQIHARSLGEELNGDQPTRTIPTEECQRIAVASNFQLGRFTPDWETLHAPIPPRSTRRGFHDIIYRP